MLGQSVSRTFSNASLKHSVYSRLPGDPNYFDFKNQTPNQIAGSIGATEDAYIVNCIGWIPQRAVGDSAIDTQLARRLNVELPRALETLSIELGIRVLQVATDCVFDGSLGSYVETDQHSANDNYGLTKSQGESLQLSAMRIRCSIIGQDFRSNAGLYSWYSSQPEGSEVSGFENHLWNGVTTDALSKLFLGLVRGDLFSPGVQHWIPKDAVSKYQLLCLFRDALGPASATVLRGAGPVAIDRTLSTSFPVRSNELWALAGYDHVPDIHELVNEMVNA
jgi:dTDP-4-dehydrorhamnose reductase